MKKRTNIQVPLDEKTHNEFKVACTIMKKNMTEVIRQFISKYTKKFEV